MSQFETFNQYRPLLFSIAYRMLGTAMDAEDVVQEAFLRWQQAKPEEVESPKAYLSTVVTRLSIDFLRSAQVQRESYIGPWLPEPLIGERGASLADAAEMTDSLSIAFLTVLESLSPPERAAFLLREVFDYGYGEIARILDKSEANCRQLVRRAHQAISERRPRFSVSAEQRDRLMMRFMQTCAEGDLQGLISLLTEDVTLRSDSGGKVTAARNIVTTPDHVARFLLGLISKMTPDMRSELKMVNGQPGMLTYWDDRLFTVLTLDMAGDKIRGVYITVNPDKLRTPPSSE